MSYQRTTTGADRTYGGDVMSATPAEQLLTVDQVAYRLQVTNAQVLKLRRAGLLAAINISAGRKPNYRWRPSVVDTFLRIRKAA